jgi:hypothetical protein
LKLTAAEQEMLEGGGPIALALREQIAVGEFFGAERMVEVRNAHFMGDPEVFGESGLEYLNRLMSSGARCAIPTTRNASCVDLESAHTIWQRQDLMEQERTARKLLAGLGVMAVNTCIGYQTLYQPQLGEHVAWGDTGTVAYANSVLGARTNYEAGAASLLAGITGRTPEYGFHLDGHRKARYVVRVDADLSDRSHWGALGAIVGTRYRGYDNVVAIDLAEHVRAPDTDDLKHLAAAIASYGSMAMFHVVGVTPEAPTLEAALGGTEPAEVSEFTPRDLDAFMGGPDGEVPSVVVFTAPQLSLNEIRDLAALIEGRTVVDGTTLIVTTSRPVYIEAERQGFVEIIATAGGVFVQDTCWYLMDPAAQRQANGWSTLATNSAKLANIVRAHGYAPTVLTARECVLASTR